MPVRSIAVVSVAVALAMAGTVSWRTEAGGRRRDAALTRRNSPSNQRPFVRDGESFHCYCGAGFERRHKNILVQDMDPA